MVVEVSSSTFSSIEDGVVEIRMYRIEQRREEGVRIAVEPAGSAEPALSWRLFPLLEGPRVASVRGAVRVEEFIDDYRIRLCSASVAQWFSRVGSASVAHPSAF